jgi:hypothetical protein
MKRQWREHDRAADRRGLTVNATVGSTNARKTWFELLNSVIGDDHVIRIRHRYFDEPVLLLRESRFRDLEVTTFDGSPWPTVQRVRGDRSDTVQPATDR